MSAAVALVLVAAMVMIPVAEGDTNTITPHNNTEKMAMEYGPDLYYLEYISPNSTYWIQIDPVPDQFWGDSFTINATTNLPTDQRIRLRGVTKEGLKDFYKGFGFPGSFGETGGVCTNYRKNQYNITSCPVNTGLLQFPNMNYSITTYPGYSPGNRSSITFRNRWVKIDPIVNPRIGDILTISGTTDIPAGSNLSVFIPKNCYDIPGRPCNTTLGWYYPDVKPGSAGSDTQIFSFSVSTFGYPPGVYRIHIFGMGLTAGTSVPFNLTEPEINGISSGQSTRSQPSPNGFQFCFIGIIILVIFNRLMNN